MTDDGPGPLAFDPFDVAYPRVILVVLMLATAVAVIVAASTSTAAFGAYNPAWDGAADLRNVAEDVETEADLVRNTSRYRPGAPTGTVAIVLSPDRAYSSSETAQIRRFVNRGGTLVVAEDFGEWSNPLLDAVGASARFNGSLLRDERYHYQSPAMPTAQPTSTHPLLIDVDQLTLNHGTVIDPGNATVVAASSEYAYLDSNRNDVLDERETLGTYPVVTVESVGQGRVIAVSDPSLFINAMLDRPGNKAFVSKTIGAHERLLLDYSHATRLPPLAVTLLIVRESGLLQALLGGGAVIAIGIWSTERGAGLVWDRSEQTAERPRMSESEMTALVAQNHPEWDDERIERVVQAIVAGRTS